MLTTVCNEKRGGGGGGLELNRETDSNKDIGLPHKEKNKL
jgi:hypothetical protein